MKLVILHAADPHGPYQRQTPENKHLPMEQQMDPNFFGWPPDCPPKALHHFQGELILERTINLFREQGIKDIRLVAGYKIDLMHKFNEEKKMDLEIIENTTWNTDSSGMHPGIVPEGRQDWKNGFDSIKLGLEKIDDDVIITLGDVCPMRYIIKELIFDKNPICSSIGHMWKMNKEYLHKFREEVIAINPIGIRKPVGVFFKKYGDVCGVAAGMGDIDAYKQTDEYRREACRHLYNNGMNFINIGEKLKLHAYLVKQWCLQDEFPKFWIQDEFLQSPNCEYCHYPLAKTASCINRVKIFASKCPRERILEGEPTYAQITPRDSS